MENQVIAKRVADYFVKRQQFWTVQGIVHSPSYNPARDPAPWKAHEYLQEWLRKEADELFSLGVSVYQ